MLKYLAIFVGIITITNSVYAETSYHNDYTPYIRVGFSAGSTTERTTEGFYELKESWMGTQLITSTSGAGVGGAMEMSSESTFGITAGLGFDFGRLRMDFMYENYNQGYDATLRMYDKLGFNGSMPYTQLKYDGDLMSHLFMANFFIQGDKSPGGLVPYIGVGIGFAKHSLNDLVQHDDNAYADSQLNVSGVDVPVPVGGFACADTKVDADIDGASTAWSFMAGLSLHLSNNLMLDFGYRYLDLGDMTVSTDRYQANMTDDFGNDVAYESFREIKDHTFSNRISEITASIRIAF